MFQFLAVSIPSAISEADGANCLADLQMLHSAMSNFFTEAAHQIFILWTSSDLITKVLTIKNNWGI